MTTTTGIKQASTVRGDRYSFDVYLANGQKKPDLKRSFLRVMELSPYLAGLNIVLEDNTEWKEYLEADVIDKMKRNSGNDIADGIVKCIVSFQVFHNGEQIAVARLYNDSKVKTKE